ncbi:MAG: hypothetical protein WDM71_00575 [Ferruginibacter sp.]
MCYFHTSAQNCTGSKLVPFLYIPNYGSNTVSVVNTATNKITDTIKVGSRPWGIAISPDGSKAYVVNSNDSDISVINTLTNKVINIIKVGFYTLDISISRWE